MNATVRIVSAAVISAALQLVGASADAADMKQAVDEFNALHHAKAKPMFEVLLKDEKQANLANYYLGRIALGAGRSDAATEYLEASVGIDPNSADELYWLAMACGARLQRPSEAGNMGLGICYMQNLETALETDGAHLPSLLAVQQLNANGQAAMGASPERAEELLAKIASFSKSDADVARLLTLNAKKETEKALSLAQTMVVAHPTSERALLEAGRVLSIAKRYPEALAAFEKATTLKVTVDNRQWIQAANVEIGFISWRTKADFDRGIAAMTKSLEDRFPINVNTNWAYLRLAQMHQSKGDTAQYQKYMQLLEASPIEKGALILPEIERLKAGGGK